MKCSSCQQELVPNNSGFTACPHCGSVTVLNTLPVSQQTIPETVMVSPFTPAASQPARSSHRTKLIIALVGACLLGGIVTATNSFIKPYLKEILNARATNTQKQQAVASTSPLATSKSSAPITVKDTSSIPGKSAPNKPMNPAPAPNPTIPAPPVCTKGSYTPAAADNTPSAGTGFKQIIDQPQQYIVYGYSANQIRSEINQCSPLSAGGSEYDAQTNWQLRYSYSWYTKSNGKCALQNVGVIVHITFMYPQWTNNAYAVPGLSSQWQKYIDNLTVHEQGHENLALQYANTLFSGLQNYPDTDCSNIHQSVNTYGDNEIASLNQSEANYDVQTKHGATQGATFP